MDFWIAMVASCGRFFESEREESVLWTSGLSGDKERAWDIWVVQICSASG
jgi:hypothetical protein